MGQTLSNGVYLPNEGERNCYAGLASNWQILNTAVGNIAEKAPLVHTHGNITNDGKVGTTANLPLITGTGGAITAGAFGNQANTFCEGNDSRLSDARTPVAHTHGKADITDLFNSANTWTGANTFSDSSPIRLKNANIEKGVQPTVFQAQNILFKDKNNSDVANIRHIVTASGTNNNADGLEFSVANKFANGALDPTGTNTVGTLRIGFWTDGQKYIYNEFRWRSSLIPFNNQTQDIGSSSYQWNNLYAKNYYYNGTAWGLDKANVWTKTQNFVGEYQGTELSNNYNTCFGMYGVRDTVGKSGMFFTKYRPNKAQGSLISSDLIQYGVDVLENEIRTNNVFDLQVRDYDSNTGKFTRIDVITLLSNANLGTSTNKWTTLNGVNPGALSLPNVRAAVADPISTVGWNLSGTRNKYTPTEDGWFYIRVSGTGSCAINIHNGDTDNSYPTWFNTSTGGYATLVVPCEKGISLYIYISATSIEYCSFHPCLGNV